MCQHIRIGFLISKYPITVSCNFEMLFTGSNYHVTFNWWNTWRTSKLCSVTIHFPTLDKRVALQVPCWCRHQDLLILCCVLLHFALKRPWKSCLGIDTTVIQALRRMWSKNPGFWFYQDNGCGKWNSGTKYKFHENLGIDLMYLGNSSFAMQTKNGFTVRLWEQTGWPADKSSANITEYHNRS